MLVEVEHGVYVIIAQHLIAAHCRALALVHLRQIVCAKDSCTVSPLYAIT